MTKRTLYAQKELSLISDCVTVGDGTQHFTKKLKVCHEGIHLESDNKIEIETPELIINGEPYPPSIPPPPPITPNLLIPMETGFAFIDGSEHGELRVTAGPLAEGGYEVHIPDVGPSDFVMTAGNQLIKGQKEFNDGVFLSDGTSLNITSGEPNIVAIHVRDQTSHTYTIPDAGANADFIMTTGTQTIAGSKIFNSIRLSSGDANAIYLAVAPQVSRTFTVPDVGANGTFIIDQGNQHIQGVKRFVNGLQFGNISSPILDTYIYDTISYTTVGVFSVTQTVTVKLIRCGLIVTCWIGRPAAVSLEATANTAGTISLNNPFPAIFRPNEITFISIGIKDNNVAETGRIRLNTDGTIQIAKLNGASFTASGVAGFINTSFSWFI